MKIKLNLKAPRTLSFGPGVFPCTLYSSLVIIFQKIYITKPQSTVLRLHSEDMALSGRESQDVRGLVTNMEDNYDLDGDY